MPLLPANKNQDEAYQQNRDTKLLIDRLSINTPLDQSTIIKPPAVYRATIAHNQMGLLEGRFVYYE